MKKPHIAALACFALALLFYVFGASHPGAGGFAFLGFIFELMAWKKVSDATNQPAALVKQVDTAPK
jgi:Na+/phosphate symporter